MKADKKLLLGMMALAALPFAQPMLAQKDEVPSGLPGALPPGQRPPILETVGVDEHLGRNVDLNFTFIDEEGHTVALKDFFHQGKPVILDLVYYACPMLCNLILNGQTAAMKEIAWTPGDQYEVVTITIDPHESVDLARQKKAVEIGSYGKPAPGWHFLVDNDGNAKKLAEQIGFHYRYDPKQQQFAHAAAIFILTPEGRIARYLYGVRFRPMDMRFALTEASENRTTLTVEKILLFCYHYDPGKHAYVLFAANFMRAGGALTVILIGWFLFRMFRMEQRRAAALARSAADRPLKERMV
jgi:protein SCO1/2